MQRRGLMSSKRAIRNPLFTKAAAGAFGLAAHSLCTAIGLRTIAVPPSEPSDPSIAKGSS